jgi:hypothetical protein
VCGAIAFPSFAQSPRAASLAANRAGDKRRLAASLQVTKDSHCCKPFVEVQTPDCHPTLTQISKHISQDIKGLICGQHKSNRECHALATLDEISRSHTIKPSRTIFGFASHPESFLLLSPTVVRPIVEIYSHFKRPASSQRRRPVGSHRSIDASLKPRQVLDPQLLIDVVANRFAVRRIGEVCTNSFNSASVSSHADQELIKSSARAAVTISYERQMLVQSPLSDGEHFRVIEFWFIIVWKFFFIGLSFPGLIKSSLRGRDKPSYCQVFGCLSAIFGSTETR